MAASEIYFRHVDWSKERPRLYDLLKELDLNEDCLAGIVVWRGAVPYVLCRSELAQSTVKLCRACHSENITPRALRSLMLEIKRLPPAEDIYSKVLQELLEHGDLLNEQTEANPFDIEEHMATILWHCGLERADHEAILAWIKVKFPKAREKYEKAREKYHF